MDRIKNIFFGLILFAVVFTGLNVGYTALMNLTVREGKTRYRYIAINETNYIASCIDKVVVRTYTLREMINDKEGDIRFFEKVAKNLQKSIKEDTGITLRNIAAAPNGIVEKVEPLENNESLIGFNYMDESKSGNKEAIETYKKAQTLITNPFSLVQGGYGMAARTPVFLSNTDEVEYWGLVSATIDFDDLLKAFDFDNFNKMHIKYCLWYKGENGEKIILDGCSDDLPGCITEEIGIYNLKWYLDVIPENGWKDLNMQALARLAIVLISILLSALVMLVFRIKRDGTMMKNLAERDSLTHCYSRHYLNSTVLDLQSGDWKNPQYNYSVAIIDVDKFKHINDEYGHVVGDRALMAIAKILNESIVNPKKDRVVRFGGDEFLVFYSNIERKDLRIKFQDILSAVEQIHFDDFPELKLTISAGVAIPEKMENKSYKEMMKRADENLYKVKENGRNNYVME